jgi:predicted TIM-barrel fold metal-dependent hydrolase
MPTIPIVDSHVHLWDPSYFRIPWLDNLPELNRPYLLADYDAATSGLEIEGIVYLQVEVATPYALMEARSIVDLAEQDHRILGIVPWAPLEFGDRARAFMAELNRISPKIKGVRRIVQDEPDPEFCLQPSFIKGTRLLPEFGLSADICCNFRQLGPNVELVRQCPETSFILDHIAKPHIRGRQFQPWADQLSELASLPNVVCKISGVVTEADHQRWTVEEIEPFVGHALSVFGEDRVVFGSDWPVVTQASGYRRWVETLDRLTQHLSPSALQKLWNGNARRFYRLDDNG